jgi:hypothetical protein
MLPPGPAGAVAFTARGVAQHYRLNALPPTGTFSPRADVQRFMPSGRISRRSYRMTGCAPLILAPNSLPSGESSLVSP